MSKIEFRGNDSHTIGVEVELGLVDEKTMGLSSSVSALMANLDSTDEGGQIKPELMQSVLEVNTNVCHTVSDAEESLKNRSQWSRQLPIRWDCDCGGVRPILFPGGTSRK